MLFFKSFFQDNAKPPNVLIATSVTTKHRSIRINPELNEKKNCLKKQNRNVSILRTIPAITGQFWRVFVVL